MNARSKATLIVGLLMSPSLVSAEPTTEHTLPQPAYRSGDIGGRFMVGLESGIFSLSRQFVTERDVSVSRESGRTNVALSIGGTPWVVFGYGLHRDWLLSGRLSASRSTAEADGQEETTTDASVSPAVTYLLGRGTVRPFVGVQGTLALRRGHLEHWGGGGGAHAGLRVEVAGRLSLEPRLAASAFWSDDNYDYGTLQGDVHATAVSASGGLRVAAWF